MKKRILIIDDDQLLSEQLSEALEALGFFIQTCTSKESAVKHMKSRKFNLCIIDYKLEDGRGSSLLRTFKIINPQCKLFVISGKSFLTETLKEEGTFQYADEIFSKPFKPQMLFKKIETDLLT